MRALLLLLSSILSPTLLATSGTNLIGVSPASQAMGGTGVANFTNGTDAIHKNPAFLVEPTATDGSVVAEAYVSYFTQNNSVDVGAGGVESTDKSILAPSLSALYQVDDKLAFGIGGHSVGGALANFSTQVTHSQEQVSKKLIRLQPAAAYRISDEFSLGVSPILLMSTLQLNARGSTTAPQTRFGFGVTGGASVRLSDKLTLGLTYTSKQKVTYKALVDVDSFGPFANAGLDDVVIEQPQEIAMGVTYSVLPELKFTFDYRNIAWRSAEAFRQLGWSDQNVFAVGTQYSFKKLALRAGFNFAKSPFGDAVREDGDYLVNFQGHTLFQASATRLNMIIFPALNESHLTLGAGLEATDDLDLDLSFVYAPKVTRTRTGTSAVITGLTPGYSVATTVSQWVLAAGAAYRF